MNTKSMIIPTWATPGHTIVELSQTHSRRSGTVIGWEQMADRPGLFPLVRWSNPAYGISFANPSWIEPPLTATSRRYRETIQVGSRVKLLYPDNVLGAGYATVVDLCDEAAELRDDSGKIRVYRLGELVRADYPFTQHQPITQPLSA